MLIIHKHLNRNTQNNILPNIWTFDGPTKLANKINHHPRFNEEHKT